MKDILEVVTFDGFLTVEKFEEFLDELRRDVHLQWADFDTLVDHQLQEELVDALQMGPSGIHILLSLDTGLWET